MRVMTAFDATTSGGSLVDCNSNQTDAAATDSSVVFPIGSVVKCVTGIPTTITGQVVCYDNQARMLLLKDTSGSKPMLRFVNLALVREVTSVNDPPAGVPPYVRSSGPYEQVEERLRKAEAKKKASLLEADVPIEGQRCFILLRKTLDDVKWEGDCISVLGRALVRPPYTTDSIEPVGDSPKDSAVIRAVDHVRKILSKHRVSSQTRTSSDDAPADPSPSQ